MTPPAHAPRRSSMAAGSSVKATSVGTGYYDFDLTGSTSGLSGIAGSYVNNYSYTPFGESLVRNTTVSNPFQYVGQAGVADDGNGLLFMRARFYSPTTGRFLSQDPIRIAGGVNLYAYALNAPAVHIDPTGTEVTTKNQGRGTYSVTVSLNIDETSNSPGFRAIAPLIGPAVSSYKFGNDIGDIYYVIAGTLNPPDPVSTPTVNIPVSVPTVTRPDIVTVPTFTRPDTVPPPGDNIPIQILQALPPQLPALIHTIVTVIDVLSVDPNDKLGRPDTVPWLIFRQTPRSPITLISKMPDRDQRPRPRSSPRLRQRVEVTDQLTTNLDWNTFRFTEFGFGDNLVKVTGNGTYFADPVIMTFNGETFEVDVELSFDASTGKVRAVFQSTDPSTGLPPDVFTGFLPPEDGTGREGVPWLCGLTRRGASHGNPDP